MSTEAHSTKCQRKLRMVDHAIFNAIIDLLPYYGLLLRADPVLAAVCEQLILGWEEDRERIRFIYRAAWRRDHSQFLTIGSAVQIINEAHGFGKKGPQLCQAYSHHWDRLAVESYKLLEQRGKALGQPSDSRRLKPDPLTPEP